ncbi:hypothetical protein RZR97_02705 [Hydrogenimonas thermophila]|uniref:hypothetical protein n=1 Tax=Hydrogenimonas thermophila TaxID=223786 RepID=UPI0029374074|nr:hypothetical protein [Hydrogenimonas thermophila]WOE70490.1 hypothetical protein RZR91_02720 [Hydrogenimonas thermophila]WOE73007.1 hypothetical protein RZR97_02705 [Hydrogenimonas thermophila]
MTSDNSKPSFSTETREDVHEYVRIDSLETLLDGKLNETVSRAIHDNSPKYFENLANRLQNEYGLEINNAEDLSKHFNKIGKPSKLRRLINRVVLNKIDEFREKNNLVDTRKFNKYLKEIEDSKKLGIVLTDDQKELKGLLAFVQKNEGLYQIFESDLRKIDANYLNFEDKIKTTIKVEVVNNNEHNKMKLLSDFKTMLGNSKKYIKSIKINDTDKKEINNILNSDEFRSKADFLKKANEYLETGAKNKNETKKYVAAIAEQKTLSGMLYMLEKDKIEEVPRSFLESRNIDTSKYEISEQEKEVNVLETGSKKNLKLFIKHIRTVIKEQKMREQQKLKQQQKQHRQKRQQKIMNISRDRKSLKNTKHKEVVVHGGHQR